MTFPNAVVKPIHQKAKPVLVAELAQLGLWRDGLPEAALRLRRPAADDVLTIVSMRPREDKG